MSNVTAVYFEDVGVIPNDMSAAVANTTAINNALAGNPNLRMKQGQTYYIGSTVILQSGMSLMADLGARPPVLFMPTHLFTNHDTGAGRYGSNAVGIKADSPTLQKNIVLKDFVIQSDIPQNAPYSRRNLRPVFIRNVDNLVIQSVEIREFSVGVGICLSMIGGNSKIEDCYIHDFYDDNNDWVVPPQTTGLELDNDIYPSGRATDGLVVQKLRIERLRVGNLFLAAYGFQTDGINIVNMGTRNMMLNGILIRDVGEGIDCFGCFNVMDSMVIEDVHNFGLKFIHGASYNSISNATIKRAGICGITVSGSGTGQDVQGNTFDSLIISDLDPKGAWSQSDTACVRLEGATFKAKGTLITNSRLMEGPNGKYGWVDTTPNGTQNFGEGLVIVGGASNQRRVHVPFAGPNVRLAGSSTYTNSLT